MTASTWRPEDTREIAELIKDIDICMFVTRSNGSVRGRPMSNNGKVEFDGDNWFFSYRDSAKVAEIEADPTVELAYIATDQGTWVSVEGRAEVVDDEPASAISGSRISRPGSRAAPRTIGSFSSRSEPSASTRGRVARRSSWNRVSESSASSPRRTRGQAPDHLARTSRIAARAGNTHPQKGCSDSSPSGTVAPETATRTGEGNETARSSRVLARAIRCDREAVAIAVPVLASAGHTSAASTLFAPYQSIALGSDTKAVAIGDVTGDGRADVVATSAQGFYDDYAVYVLAGLPDGTLAAPVSYPTPGTGTNRIESVAIGDITNEDAPMSWSAPPASASSSIRSSRPACWASRR